VGKQSESAKRVSRLFLVSRLRDDDEASFIEAGLSLSYHARRFLSSEYVNTERGAMCSRETVFTAKKSLLLPDAAHPRQFVAPRCSNSKRAGSFKTREKRFNQLKKKNVSSISIANAVSSRALGT
jgi:hypothetical protein